MSYIKRWLEEHISEITDEELKDNGFSDEEIIFLRESFEGTEEARD